LNAKGPRDAGLLRWGVVDEDAALGIAKNREEVKTEKQGSESTFRNVRRIDASRIESRL